jgi:hypothetical protein
MGRVSEIIAYSNATPEEQIDLLEKLTHITITPEIENFMEDINSCKGEFINRKEKPLPDE